MLIGAVPVFNLKPEPYLQSETGPELGLQINGAELQNVISTIVVHSYIDCSTEH